MRPLNRFLSRWILALALSAGTAAAADNSVFMELDEALGAMPVVIAPERSPAAQPKETRYDEGNADDTPAHDAYQRQTARADAGETQAPPQTRVRVTARRHTVLSSQLNGRIEEMTVEDGDQFDKGDLLVRLDSSVVDAQIARARAAVERARVLYQMNSELADMQSKGMTEVEVSRMELEAARAELQGIELLGERTIVTAPFPGRVADVFAREMQHVTEGTPLLEIFDDTTLQLEFIVPSRWIRWFTPGFAFSVTVDETGREYQAVLERLGGKVDPLSQSIKAYANLVSRGVDLIEGMSGTAHITAPEETAE